MRTLWIFVKSKVKLLKFCSKAYWNLFAIQTLQFHIVFIILLQFDKKNTLSAIANILQMWR